MKPIKKPLPTGVRIWTQYEDKPCEYKDVAACYSKTAGALASKMKRSNNNITWPEHLRTERNMHFLMQTPSAQEQMQKLAKWMTEAAKAKINQTTVLKPKNRTPKPDVFKEEGYNTELKKMEYLVAKAASDLHDTLEGCGDAKEIMGATQVYNMLVQALHKFKKDSFGIHADDGDFIHIDTVVSDILPVLSMMKSDLLSQSVIISSTLSGIESSDLIAQKIKAMVNKILDNAIKKISQGNK